MTTDDRDTNTLPRSPDDAPMAMPPHGVRRTTHPLPGRHPLSDTRAGMRGFLAHRIAATAPGHLNPYWVGAVPLLQATVNALTIAVADPPTASSHG